MRPCVGPGTRSRSPSDSPKADPRRCSVSRSAVRAAARAGASRPPEHPQPPPPAVSPARCRPGATCSIPRRRTAGWTGRWRPEPVRHHDRGRAVHRVRRPAEAWASGDRDRRPPVHGSKTASDEPSGAVTAPGRRIPRSGRTSTGASCSGSRRRCTSTSSRSCSGPSLDRLHPPVARGRYSRDAAQTASWRA